MASLADIVIDCAHPASLARFWAGVLDDRGAEVARVIALGAQVVDATPARFTVLDDPEGNEFCIMD